MKVRISVHLYIIANGGLLCTKTADLLLASVLIYFRICRLLAVASKFSGIGQTDKPIHRSSCRSLKISCLRSDLKSNEIRKKQKIEGRKKVFLKHPAEYIANASCLGQNIN